MTILNYFYQSFNDNSLLNRLTQMGARFGAFHHTKYIKSHDDMAQIILPSKIKCVDTSDEIQNH